MIRYYSCCSLQYRNIALSYCAVSALTAALKDKLSVPKKSIQALIIVTDDVDVVCATYNSP